MEDKPGEVPKNEETTIKHESHGPVHHKTSTAKPKEHTKNDPAISGDAIADFALDFVKRYWHWLALFGVFAFAVWLRLLPLQHMAKYLPDIDVYYIYRMAEYVATHNYMLPVIDFLRAYPTAILPSQDFIGVFYFPALIYNIWNAIAPISFFEFAKAIAGILGAAVAIPVYLIGKEWHSKMTGLLAAFFFATSGSVMYRTAGGVFEKEAIATVFLVFSVYFMLRGLKRDSLLSGILSGLCAAVLATQWGGVSQLHIGFALIVIISLLVNAYSPKLLRLYTGFFFAGVILGSWISPTVKITSFFVLLNLLAMGVLWLRWAVEKFRLFPKEKMRLFAPGLYVLIIVAVVVGSVFSPTIASLAATGANSIFYQQEVIESTVAENISPDWNQFAGAFSPVYAQAFFPALGPIVPLLGVWLLVFLGFLAVIYKVRGGRDSKLGAMLLLGLISIAGYSAFLFSPSFAPHAVFLLTFVAVMIFVARRDTVMLLMLSILFVGMLGALSKVRIIYVLGPFAALFAGYALANGSEFVLRKAKLIGAIAQEKKLLRRVTNPAAILLVVVLGLYIISHGASGYVLASGIGPSFNDNWAGAMNFMKTNTSVDSVILSWWDFGYWFQLNGQRATVLDGGHPHGERDVEAARYFTGKMNLSEQEEYLKKYGVTHILVDYSMVGKYPAMSKIATGGKQIDAFTTFTLTQRLERNNKTIAVYSAGPYSIWLPLTSGGGLGGAILFSTPRGDAYIGSVCGPFGRLPVEVPANASTLQGCVFVGAQAVYFANDDVAKSETAKFYFMDGLDIPYAKKVFDNGEVKIFETSFPIKTRGELIKIWRERGWCTPNYPLCVNQSY